MMRQIDTVCSDMPGTSRIRVGGNVKSTEVILNEHNFDYVIMLGI